MGAPDSDMRLIRPDYGACGSQPRWGSSQRVTRRDGPATYAAAARPFCRVRARESALMIEDAMRAGPTARGAVLAAAAGVLALAVAPAALAVAPAASAAPTSMPGHAARLVVGGAQLGTPGVV